MHEAKAAIVIPTRNRPDFLRRCLSSLANQKFPTGSWEVLICDDGSSEDVLPTVDGLRARLPGIRLLRQPAKGPAAARNMGIRSSSAEIFVFLDSDVVCAPDFLAHIIECLHLHQDWIGAEACIRASDGQPGPLWDAPESETGGRYHTAAIAYRREALFDVGGFDEAFTLAACEDVELAARLRQQGEVGFVPEAVVFHPRRRVTLHAHWLWHKQWRYVMILAKRHGFLAFPGRTAGPFPKLRVALAAVVTLPVGRFLQGLRHMTNRPHEGVLACIYALFDVLCGIRALPVILFGEVPPRLSYLKANRESILTNDQTKDKNRYSHAAT